MKRAKPLAWVLLFLAFLILPTLLSPLLSPCLDGENYENREKAPKPALTLANYTAFPAQYEAYYNDNLPFRNQLVALSSGIDYYLFRHPSSPQVAIGQNGWLFYHNRADGDPIEQSLGYWLFTEEELQAIAENLMATKRVLESQGVEFVLFICPNKETIYREELPAYYTARSSTTNTDQLIDYLKAHTDIRVVCPKQEILQAKAENPDLLLYCRLDTHWNNAGAYIGAQQLAAELGAPLPGLGQVTLTPQPASTGDLARMLNLTFEDGDLFYQLSGFSSRQAEALKLDFDHEFIYQTPGADPRRLVVARDSYATALAPILATQFERSVWVHIWHFDQQAIFENDADLFVFETVERNLPQLASFRVSAVSAGVKELENGEKEARIAAAILGGRPLYYTVTRAAGGAGPETLLQLDPLEEPLVLRLPRKESGSFLITVFADAAGTQQLEEVRLSY